MTVIRMMPQHGCCQQCKWWDTTRECLRVYEIDSLALLDSFVDTWHELITSPNFGCVQWEMK